MNKRCKEDLLLKIPIGNYCGYSTTIGEKCGYSTTLGKYVWILSYYLGIRGYSATIEPIIADSF